MVVRRETLGDEDAGGRSAMVFALERAYYGQLNEEWRILAVVSKKIEEGTSNIFEKLLFGEAELRGT